MSVQTSAVLKLYEKTLTESTAWQALGSARGKGEGSEAVCLHTHGF